jgi:hypothetical protein
VVVRRKLRAKSGELRARSVEVRARRRRTKFFMRKETEFLTANLR